MNQIYKQTTLFESAQKPNLKFSLAAKKLGLTVGKKKTGGRNNQGRITAYHRGGGNKIRYIYINRFSHNSVQTKILAKKDNKFSVNPVIASLASTYDCFENKSSYVFPSGIDPLYARITHNSIIDLKREHFATLTSGEVRYLVRDPNRTAWVAGVYWSNTLRTNSVKLESNGLAYSSKTRTQALLEPSIGYYSVLTAKTNPWYNSYSNILAPEGLRVGSSVEKFSLRRGTNFVTPGSKAYLKDLMIGTIVHNIDDKYIRSAGCSGIIISKVPSVQTSLDQNTDLFLDTASRLKVTVKLQSGQYKVFSGNTLASIGVISNGDHSTIDYKKAGQKRWLGRRPIVRGVAMNPIDHPHGGGEGKSSGGRPSVTPWGKPTKGKPTRAPKKPKLIKHSLKV